MTLAQSGSWRASSVGLAASAVTLGLALQVANGFYDPTALGALAVALVLAIVGVLLIPAASPREVTRSGLLPCVVLAGGVAIQMAVLLLAMPGMYVGGGARLGLFKAGVALEALCVALGLLRIRAVARLWFPAVLVIHLALGAWMMSASPSPPIDVVQVHQRALRALGRGRNPYRITFTNIYDAASGFYNPQALSGGRVLFGYPYPPMSLLLAAPGQLLFRDYRYAELAALVGAAALLGYARASLMAQLAAMLLLTTPRAFFVLEQGWTEPVAVLMLAATTFGMVRRTWWSAWVAGLFVATKQYLGLAAPLLWRFGAREPGGALPFLGRAGLAATIVTLPFALWNLRAFVDTVILLQTKEPFRTDSLSFVSWAARAGWGEGSFLWAIGAALAVLALVLWRTPNTAAGFAGCLTLSTFAMFAMGSKAFCNYYFFVVGACCCTLAALAADRNEPA